jgi:hypothetical protein
MQIEGKVVKIMPVESGTGKTGNAWKKQPFVIEYGDKYPKQVCVTMWNDAIVPLSAGDSAKVQFDLESREFNGKYYTEVKAWKVEKVGAENHNIQEPTPEQKFNGNYIPSENSDDLPF